MANASVLWLASLGVITALLGCCLLYALRQVTVLRESIDNLVADLTGIRATQQSTSETIESLLHKKKEEEEEAEARRLDSEEMLRRLRLAEHTLQEQDHRITDAARRASEAATLAVQRERDVKLTLSEDLSRGYGRSSADVKAVYDEVLSAIREETSVKLALEDSPNRGGKASPVPPLQEKESSPARSSGAASFSRFVWGVSQDGGDRGGLSFSLPPALIVFVSKPAGFKGRNYVRRVHRLQVGLGNSDLALCFGPSADAPPETVIPIDSVVSVQLYKDKIAFDDSDCVTVEITRQSGHCIVDTTACSGGGGSGGGSPPGSASRRRNARRVSSSSTDDVFTFCIPPCPGLDAWVSFMGDNVSHKLIIRDEL